MSGELILIIEDHAHNRKLVRDVLQYQGYATLETETAEEGIELAQKHSPALILIDNTGMGSTRGVTSCPQL